MNPEIFEALMLVSLGLAWPFSIYKLIKTKRAHGKSYLFLIAVFMGYCFGMLFVYYGERNAVFFLYMLNAGMVLTDFLLTLKYRKNR